MKNGSNNKSTQQSGEPTKFFFADDPFRELQYKLASVESKHRKGRSSQIDPLDPQ